MKLKTDTFKIELETQSERDTLHRYLSHAVANVSSLSPAPSSAESEMIAQIRTKLETAPQDD